MSSTKPDHPWNIIPGYPKETIKIPCPFKEKYLMTNPFGTESERYGRRWDPPKGWRPKKTGEKGMHRGIDFGCPLGTMLYAPTHSLYESNHDDQGFGWYIRFLFAWNGKVYWIYLAHMEITPFSGAINLYSGKHLGRTGMSGNTTGPHLHMEAIDYYTLLPVPFTFQEKE